MKEARSKATDEKEWLEAWLEEWWEADERYRRVRSPDGEAWKEWDRYFWEVRKKRSPEAVEECLARKRRLEEDEKRARERLEEVERKGRKRLGMED